MTQPIDRPTRSEVEGLAHVHMVDCPCIAECKSCEWFGCHTHKYDSHDLRDVLSIIAALRQAQQQLAERNDDEPTCTWCAFKGTHGSECTCDADCGSDLCNYDLTPDDWQEPTTPKPHVHERFKLIYSEDGREVVLRVCEDCQYADTEDYWRGWQARGLVEQGVHDATAL